MIRRASLAAGSVALVAALGLLPAQASEPIDSNYIDVVIIYTDDQRAIVGHDGTTSLSTMPFTSAELVDKGFSFPNAFVVNPLCCPSRATMLTGTSSHVNQVWTNRPPGSLEQLDTSDTIATWLNDQGYQTGLFGKYGNAYAGKNIPPGWDSWFAMVRQGYRPGEWSYRSLGRSAPRPGMRYSTDQIASRAASFIRGTDPDLPLLAVVTPFAPHVPATPPKRYAGMFDTWYPDDERYRPDSFNEGDLSDKPGWVRRFEPMSKDRIAKTDRSREKHTESLRAVDDLVASVVGALEETGRLEHTLIVLASDNGFLWGEHRLTQKGKPYDAVVRIPLVVRADFLGLTPGTREQIALNLDIAPTVLEAAGLDPTAYTHRDHALEGLSLLSTLTSDSPTREVFLGEKGVNQREDTAPPYCTVRTLDAMLVRYASGTEEYYDYLSDPWELENQIAVPGSTPQTAASIDQLRAELDATCTDPPGYPASSANVGLP